MELVLAAGVTAFGGVIVAWIGAIKEFRTLRKENDLQHLDNKNAATEAANEILAAVKEVDIKVDNHIQWHAHNPPQPVLQIVKEN